MLRPPPSPLQQPLQLPSPPPPLQKELPAALQVRAPPPGLLCPAPKTKPGRRRCQMRRSSRNYVRLVYTCKYIVLVNFLYYYTHCYTQWIKWTQSHTHTLAEQRNNPHYMAKSMWTPQSTVCSFDTSATEKWFSTFGVEEDEWPHRGHVCDRQGHTQIHKHLSNKLVSLKRCRQYMLMIGTSQFMVSDNNLVRKKIIWSPAWILFVWIIGRIMNLENHNSISFCFLQRYAPVTKFGFSNLSWVNPLSKQINNRPLHKKINPTSETLSEFSPAPVSWFSVCTQEKCLKVQLQANAKLVVLSLMFGFVLLWMHASRRGGEGKNWEK